MFSQVRAAFVLPVPFFFSLIRNFFQTAKKHCVFTGKCCMCLSSHFFLLPNSQLIPQWAKIFVFTGKRCMSLSSHFFLFPNSRLPVKRQCFVQLGISCELGLEKKGTGDRQEAFTCEKPMSCTVWNKISSM